VNTAGATPVDRLYQEASAIVEQLGKATETSLQISAGDNFRKALLLAAASHFESRICHLLVDFVRERSGNSTLVESFVKNRAISRQYHTLFNWNENNANHFFGFFGTSFKTAMSQRIRDSEQLGEAIKAFMAIGSERNRLVHLDYACFPLEKTLDEIYSLFQKGLFFLDHLPKALRECDGCSKD